MKTNKIYSIVKNIFAFVIICLSIGVGYYLIRFNMIIPLIFLLLSVIIISQALFSKEMKENDDNTISYVKEDNESVKQVEVENDKHIF